MVRGASGVPAGAWASAGPGSAVVVPPTPAPPAATGTASTAIESHRRTALSLPAMPAGRYHHFDGSARRIRPAGLASGRGRVQAACR
jgi:hypothetical protein